MNSKLFLTFLAMGIGILVVTVDITSINVALPAIEKSFDIDLKTIEWIINGYLLAFAVLMVTCGRLADMYGRKKIFLIGLCLFGIASLIAGLSQSAGLLIAMRVLQGAAGAFLWPTIIGICYASVSDTQKGFAIGIVMAVSGFGNAAGPLVGGFLTEYFSWRWVLFINVPLALLAGIITLIVVKEQDTEDGDQGVDYPGILLISLSVISFLYALDQSTVWGLISLPTLGLILLSIVLLYLFIKIEPKVLNSLIPPDVMKNKSFMTYCIIMFTFAPTFFCLFLYIPQYLEKFKHYTPIQAGAGLVPMLITYGIISPFTGKIFDKFGPRLTIFAGMLITALGTYCTVLFGFNNDIIFLAISTSICGIGIGLTIPAITTAGVSTVKESRASLASGLIFMFQLCGAALGLAIISTIFIDTAINDFGYRVSSLDLNLTSTEINYAKSFLLGSSLENVVQGELGESLFAKLIPHIRESYIKGLQFGLGFSGSVIVLGAIINLIFTKETAK
jgi:EmrB/QacA subfamily drug resistance transporter